MTMPSNTEAGRALPSGLDELAAAVRHDFERMRFPVFARLVSMHRSIKRSPGRIGEAATVGGVLVSPGDVVVADTDGVFVCEVARFEATLKAGEVRAAREVGLLARIEKGELTLDLLDLRTAASGSEP